jgi:hypothetical protein
MRKLDRILKYLNGTQNLYIKLSPDELKIHMWIDASFGIHSDGKSHTGTTTFIGASGGPIMSQSSKQKLVTTSSTASEFVATSDKIKYIEWLRNLLSSLGFDQKEPSIVYQDNMSTIKLAEKGEGNFGTTRHLNVRFFKIKELIDNGTIKLVYCPTEHMIADILTKPLSGKLFLNLRRKLLNCDEN